MAHAFDCLKAEKCAAEVPRHFKAKTGSEVQKGRAQPPWTAIIAWTP
jgi:hypothetical protein